jgi:hypothetical protein
VAGAALALVGLAAAVGFERVTARRTAKATAQVPTPRSAGHDTEHFHDALAS